ncbi:Trypsin [Metarhizium anisopliae]|nr:Trypsin [Metarhizium anisopliae]
MARKSAIMLAVACSTLLTTAATIDKRLAGGEAAQIGDIPSMVSIQNERGYHECGGTLLDSTTVLTAAHCLGSSHAVRAGTLVKHLPFYSPLPGNAHEGGVIANISSRKPHPNYKKQISIYDTPENDIAIVKLLTPIEKSDIIDYALLPADGSNPVADSAAIAAGCYHQLIKVELPVRGREFCEKIAPKIFHGKDTYLCVGGDGKGACHRDSGGPLFDKETKQFIGLTSFGMGRFPCGPTNPSVYTRISGYISFIKENMGGSSSV